MFKNVKMYTKMIIGFVIMDVLFILTLVFGYQTAETIIGVENPEHYLQSYRIFTIVMFVIACLVMGYISIYTSGTIRKSVKMLSDAAEQIAAGKVDITLKKLHNDEFGTLIDDYQEVINNIYNEAKIAEEVANGNLTVEVVPRSEEDLLGLSLKRLVQKNNHALSSISDAATQVTTNASEVASASEALAQGSTEQASAIEQITASITDVAEKTKQNAGEADRAAQLVSHAIEEVNSGNAQMHDMMAAMEDINKSSESISKIIKVIDDIAFQTNILALNAAVEAARAGDAGKGFAVVAEEVRNLAAKSAAAAAETAEMIEDSIRKVSAGSEIAEITAKALENITSAVKESGMLIQNIAEASNYQAVTIEQIDQAVEQVSQVVQNNSATSEECAAASIQLSNEATKMHKLLAVFRLSDDIGETGALRGKQAEDTGAEDRNEQIISLGDDFGKY